MLSWEEVPEASGPQSEGTLFNAQYGDPGYPSIGAPPKIMSDEQRDRERAADARRYEMRQAAELAAFAAGMSVLEAAAAAEKLLREASEAGKKAVRS